MLSEVRLPIHLIIVDLYSHCVKRREISSSFEYGRHLQMIW